MKILSKQVWVILLLLGTVMGAEEIRKWPLKNGDFSTAQGHGVKGELGGLPSGWSLHSESGRHKCAMGAAEFLRPAGTIVSTVEAGRGVLVQEVFLLAGDYQLAVEVMEEGYSKGSGDIELSVTAGDKRLVGEQIRVGNSWAKLTLDVSVPAGEASIGLACIGPAGNAVKFRSAELTVKRLESSPVPLADGRRLGGVVLAENADLAEQYACYELQRYIYRMTGAMPGLLGRDGVHDGVLIRLGQTAGPEVLSKLEPLATDSYVTQAADGEIVLAGNSGRGTLYAVYDFLQQQGCRWVMPGELGEVVPKRDSLSCGRNKLESPDYECRGFMILTQDFYPTGGQGSWRYIDFDAYSDWFVRNRLNAIWYAGTESYDLGAHRGHGWVQLLNHSYNSVIAPHSEFFQEHPQWYPLVNGRRMPECNLSPNFPNQLCVSNQALRDYTVDLVLEYFRNNPAGRAFPLNPMDGPSFWCECDECKALDPPGIDWSDHVSKGHVAGMSDRALNYANEVAQRVTQVYPDKYIEMYAYGYTLDPPVQEKAHPNVLIKYANLSGGRGTGPLGESIMAENVPIWQDWRRTLDGWKNANAHLAFYCYLEWEHPDVTLLWFYNTVDLLKNLNRQYGFLALMGETENDQYGSVMLYNILARAVWDVDTDYREVIRDICDAFYGPAANDMYEYNIKMSDAINQSQAWREEGWRPNHHLDLSLEVLAQGQAMLDRARAKLQADKILLKRLAYAQFGHACLTLTRAVSEKNKTAASADAARKAFDTANALREQYGIMVKIPTVGQLESFYYPAITGDVALALPEIWCFKQDPQDIGISQGWFKDTQEQESWTEISTFQEWTGQPAGMEYHGVGWYKVDFVLPADMKVQSDLVLRFGAVDGYATVYLDGHKIGEQTADVGMMWDKPFTVELPANIDKTATHHLVVRVRKDDFAAGIWKPVVIAKALQQQETMEFVDETKGRVDW